MDLEQGFITLENGETKNGEGRMVPILEGDIHDLSSAAKKERDMNWPDSPWVFNRQGEPIKDFRWAAEQACKRAGVPRSELSRPEEDGGSGTCVVTVCLRWSV